MDMDRHPAAITREAPLGHGRVRRFLRDSDGAALVEFAILLPMLLVVFTVIIEGGRLMWSYQSAAAGVRDAARYLARATPSNICASGGSVTGFTDEMEAIVRNSIGGNALFPVGITVNSVTPSLNCVTGSYRISPAPVAQVTASLTVTFPLGGLFSLVSETLGTVTTTITDQSRVFGL